MTRNKRPTRQSKTKYTPQSQEIVNVLSKKIQTTKLIKAVNAKQKSYTDSIHKNVITFALGSAGCGKTILALFEGIKLINSENSEINKIFYLRSNIGMSHENDLGAMPGVLGQKILPLAYPVLDCLINFMSEGQSRYLIESNLIEVLPVGMVRGRTFANCFIIVDEVQNYTTHMIRTVITRIGENSKMVFIGDGTQCDFKDTSLSGIEQVAIKLKGVEDIGIVEFVNNEIIRHPIIGHILDRL